MKFADLMQSVEESTPNLEFEIERKTKNAKPIKAVFRNILRLSAERRERIIGLKQEAAKGDNLTKQAEAEKAALTLMVEDEKHIEEMEKLFSQAPDERDMLWVHLAIAYDKATQPGEANSSQTR